MKRCLALCLIFTFLLCGCGDPEGTADNPNEQVKETVYSVGVATMIINPRESDKATLAGFGYVDRGYEGHRDDIELSTAVFSSKGLTFAILSADILGWDSDVMDRVRARVESEIGFPGENILFNATHTHSGPTTQKNTVGIGKVSESYNEFLISQTVACIRRAYDDREDCTLYQGKTDAKGIAMNRRKEVNGTVTMTPDPEKECCEECDIIYAKCGDDVKLILFSFGCHPSIMNGNYMTADFVGAARTVMKNRYPTATPLFVQGCGGDAKPNALNDAGTGFVYEDYNAVKKIGNLLAQNVLSFISLGKGTQVADDLAFSDVSFTLPLQKHSYTREEFLEKAESNRHNTNYDVYMWYYENFDNLPDSAPYLIQRIDFGNGMTVIAMMGEVVWGYDKLVSDLLPDRNVMVAGYSNGVYGYICTEEVYEEGGYEPFGSTDIYQLSYGYPSNVEKLIMARATALCAK